MSITVEDVAGTTYTILSADDGKIKRFTDSSAITVTVPDTLTEGFECLLTQAGTGQITCVAGGTSTFLNKEDIKSRKINSYFSLTAEQDAVFKFSGELSIDAYIVKTNYSAIVDPGVNDDETQGYVVGSRWFNLANGTVLECFDATTGAAVWGGGGGGYQHTEVVTIDQTDSPYAITSGDFGKLIEIDSATTSEVTITCDPAVLTTFTEFVKIKNRSGYRGIVEVDDSGTDTFDNSATEKIIWKGEKALLIYGDNGTTNMDTE